MRCWNPQALDGLDFLGGEDADADCMAMAAGMLQRSLASCRRSWMQSPRVSCKKDTHKSTNEHLISITDYCGRVSRLTCMSATYVQEVHDARRLQRSRKGSTNS